MDSFEAGTSVTVPDTMDLCQLCSYCFATTQIHSDLKENFAKALQELIPEIRTTIQDSIASSANPLAGNSRLEADVEKLTKENKRLEESLFKVKQSLLSQREYTDELAKKVHQLEAIIVNSEQGED